MFRSLLGIAVGVVGKRRKELAVLFGATLFSLIFLEISLQFLYRIQNGAWLHDDNAAFRVSYTQPVGDRRQYTLRPGYRDEQLGLTIDKHGFRNTGRQKPYSGRVAVVLGDSVPFGAGVSDEHTYPAVLERLLSKSQHTDRISVLNAAVPSYNLRQSYDRLRYEVLHEINTHQIVVVTIQAANDISLLTHYRERWTPDVTWAKARWSRLWGKHPSLATESYLLLAIKNLHKVAEEKEHHEQYPGEQMLHGAVNTLREFDAFARTNDLHVVLMPIDPFYYQTTNTGKNEELRFWSKYHDYVEKWGSLIEEFNDVLEAASKTSDKLIFFDTRNVMDRSDRGICYIDFIHLSAHGNEVVAESLFAYLQSHGLIS